MMFNFNAILFDAYIVGTVVDMNASIFGANPHCRLIAITFVGIRVLEIPKKKIDVNRLSP